MNFERIYYKLDIESESPLSVGSGANTNTDNDIIVDSTGVPFIPASSIAGVLRHYLSKKTDRVTVNKLFGYIPDSREAYNRQKSGDEEYRKRQSLIRVYDALYVGKDSFFITNRECISLENKVAKNKAKFNLEALEAGAEFISYIELSDKSYSDVIENAFSAIDSGVIRFGSKTTRGYGRVKIKVKKKTITDSSEWLDFDMYDDKCWSSASEIQLDDISKNTIRLKLKSVGGLSIRVYSTEPCISGKNMPDFSTISLKNGDPVIPGTSFAGTIRHRFEELAGKEKTENLFGFVHDKKTYGNNEACKSKIIFSESKLSNGEYKTVTRSAVDRFSGKVKRGALYTEKAYFYGETETEISFTREPTKDELMFLSICFADLNNGFIGIGGLTSIGRGLFNIISINGVNADFSSPKEIFSLISQCTGEVQHEDNRE